MKTSPRTDPPARRAWWSKITRDLVLFAVGLGLIVNEGVFRQGPERPSLLVLYAGMTGLPAIFRYDEQRRKDGRK